MDQGRLVAVRGCRMLRWRGSSTRAAPAARHGRHCGGRPRSATGSWKPGLRPVEGGPWWLCWTEGKVVELRSRLAPGPQERHSCCLCGGPVRLYAIVYMTVTVWNEAADGLHQREPQLWNKCVVSPPYGSHGSKEQYN